MSAVKLQKISLAEEVASLQEAWRPRVLAELNGQEVKVARLEGEFVWHHHADEDELFLLLDGELSIELRDGSIELSPGELVVIPKGVEHRPVAAERAHVLLFEPAGVRNTGNVVDERLTAD